MEIEKRIHNGYREFIEAKKKGINIEQCFGEFQYIYSDKGKKISLVQLNGLFNNVFFWEIFCLEGNLFEDVERFETKELADKRIKELMK